MCYIIHHVEKNGRNRGNPWSLRETGIYHQINIATGSSRWIFIQPSGPTREDIIQNLELGELRQSPFDLHAEVLLSMARNWPEYIEYLSQKLDEMVNTWQPK